MSYYSGMSPSSLVIRQARLDDAPVLAHAERCIAATPGLLVSQPAELTDDRFSQKVAALSDADNGKYLVAEMAGQVVGHGMLPWLRYDTLST
jgi:hypothetical protein